MGIVLILQAKKEMKTLLYISFAAAIFSGCNSPVENKEATENEVSGLLLPEGAVRSGQYIYVSNVGREFKPLDKDGDGFISRHNLDGTIDSTRFIPLNDTLHSPKGMGVIGKTIYVTDIDVLKGYNLQSGEKIFSMDFSMENTSLLNDIAVKNDSTLFISAMDIGKIYEVNLKTQSYKLVLEKPRPNGLFWDKENESLYLGMFGREENANGDHGDIGVIAMKDSIPVYTELTGYQGNIDGVTKFNNTLYFTDWLSKGDKGSLLSLDLTTLKIDTLLQNGIFGPGDFYFDEESENFYIPKMRENKLLIFNK